MNRITLNDLANMLIALPPDVRAKELVYLDLGYINHEELEDLRQRLIDSDDADIKQCQN